MRCETLTDSFSERSLVPYSHPKDGTLNLSVLGMDIPLGSVYSPSPCYCVSFLVSLERGGRLPSIDDVIHVVLGWQACCTLSSGSVLSERAVERCLSSQ